MSSINFKCAVCGALQKNKHMQEGKCWRCKTKYEIVDDKKKSTKGLSIIYPKCPNKECDNHLGHTPPKQAFTVSVITDGLMGSIFKSEAINMVSCKECGHIIGVSGKGG